MITYNYISMWKIQIIIFNFPNPSNSFTKNLPQKLNEMKKSPPTPEISLEGYLTEENIV